MRKFIILVAVVFTFVAVGCGPEPNPEIAPERLEEIAKCLTEKGVAFYGAIWCPHCKDQKDMFGEAFEYVDSYECDPNTNLEEAKICLEVGIEAFPTWILPSGEKVSGAKNPEVLAAMMGC